MRRWAGLLIGALAYLGVAGSGAAEYEKLYFGQRIRIVTTPEAEGRWRATAELPDIQARRLTSDAYASEEAACSAALSAAMAELDRRRARTGKP